MCTYSSQNLSCITVKSFTDKRLLNLTNIKQVRRVNQHRDASFPRRLSGDWRPEAYGKMPSLERDWVWKCALGEHWENARTRSAMWVIRESEEYNLWNDELYSSRALANISDVCRQANTVKSSMDSVVIHCIMKRTFPRTYSLAVRYWNLLTPAVGDIVFSWLHLRATWQGHLLNLK